MSEKENLDIGKVVSLIMENPALIEQISRLAKGDVATEEPTVPETLDVPEESVKENSVSVSQTPLYDAPIGRKDRARLLCALKPYVSNERAKAIDSMISIVDILDMMRSR